MGGAGDDDGYPGGSGDDEEDDALEESAEPSTLNVRRFMCTVQFCWKPTLLTDRLEDQKASWEIERKKQPADPAGDSAG